MKRVDNTSPATASSVMSVKKVSAGIKTGKYQAGFIKVHGDIPHCSMAYIN